MPNEVEAKKRGLSYSDLRSKVFEARKHLNIIFTFLKPYFFVVIVNYAANLAQTAIGWLTPVYTGGIVDIVTRSKDADHLYGLLRNMFIFSLINKQVSRICAKTHENANTSLDRNLKGEIYKKMLSCDMEFFDKVPTNDASMIINSGVANLISLCVIQFTGIIQKVFDILGTFYCLYTLSPELAKIVIVVTPVRFALSFFSFQGQIKRLQKRSELFRNVLSLPRNAMQNILLVKCFSTEKREHKEYVDTQNELSQFHPLYSYGSWPLELLKIIINNGLNIYLIYHGGKMVFKGTITVGDLSMFNMYSSSFIHSTSNIHHNFQRFHSAYKKSFKILEILDLSSRVVSRESKNLTKVNFSGSISIENVSFSYPAKPDVEVLSQINLKINAGEAVAFVGVSGSGKTTLSYLLHNLYTPTQGKIFVDGEDIRDYDISWLHHRMGYVPQEPVLFDKTVKQNVAYGLQGDYQPEQIDRALTLSNSRFILNKDKFPDRLSTRLGSGATKLSGGQKQRIAIARAFVKDPKILILDEPTSALDGESESKVQKAIDDLVGLGDRTVIVIAHRLSTIINCHKIVVFDEGRVVEQGTHRELIEKDGAYKKLFEFQIDNMKKL